MLSKIENLMDFYNSTDEFVSAIAYTAEFFGFPSDLIEKDFLCSLILIYLYEIQDSPLVFKGGTLLAKAYADFYRLSEDLDFMLPIPVEATRKQRSTIIKPTKKLLSTLNNNISFFYTLLRNILNRYNC